MFTDCSDDEMVSSLTELHLDHLISRLGSLDAQCSFDWYVTSLLSTSEHVFLVVHRYDLLSPGEMQRLSFVRLFYHKPRLAGTEYHFIKIQALCTCTRYDN